MFYFYSKYLITPYNRRTEYNFTFKGENLISFQLTLEVVGYKLISFKK